MRPNRPLLLLTLAFAPLGATAQENFKVEPLNEAPPAALAAPIRETLEAKGYRVLDAEGKPFADFWLRKDAPASARPAGPKGTILFPVLAEGELLGAMKFAAEGHDYRDQSIEPGVYTLRYLLQPENGDHLGTSPTRDFLLLLPAAKDKEVADLPRKRVEDRSSEAAGTSHPAVFQLREAPGGKASSAPAIVHDEAQNTWGAVVPLTVKPRGESAAATLPIQLIVVGSKTA